MPTSGANGPMVALLPRGDEPRHAHATSTFEALSGQPRGEVQGSLPRQYSDGVHHCLVVSIKWDAVTDMPHTWRSRCTPCGRRAGPGREPSVPMQARPGQSKRHFRLS